MAQRFDRRGPAAGTPESQQVKLARDKREANLDGQTRDARKALEKAQANNEVDAEVAAHLGEVLWANGKQREARQIWEKFLKEQPESPILRGTIKRLTGSETL